MPADPVKVSKYNKDDLSRVLIETEVLIKQRIREAGIADEVNTKSYSKDFPQSVSYNTITVTLTGLSDREQAIKIMTSSAGMPVPLKVISERKQTPNPFAPNFDNNKYQNQ